MAHAQYNLTIPNPDDPQGPPIYDGDPWEVHTVLEPGVYKAIIEDWVHDSQSDLNVYVSNDSTTLGRFVL